jgi:hypothetical protein
MTKKVSNEELGKLLEEFAEREEWMGVETLSDEEREARLAKMGVDRDEARAIGARAHDKTLAETKEPEAPRSERRKAEPAKIIPLPPRRARWPIPLAIAASFAALATFEGPALVAWLEKPPDVYVAERPPPEIAQANDLVDLARVAVVHERYQEALEKLDQAVKIYPPAAEYEATKKWRKVAEEGLAAQKDGGGVVEASAAP